MCFPADESYRKDRRHPPGHGYGRELRAGVWTAARPAPVAGLLIHATHGRPGSQSTSEAAFLRDSREVSAHYLIGRDGLIYRILPDDVVAWHAGRTVPGFGNLASIGIEIHAATTESILAAQRAALGFLCRALILQHSITPAQITTHRAAALPPGRKSDPAMWDEAEFVAWRAALFTEVRE